MRLVYHLAAVAYHHHPTSLKSFLMRQKRVGHSAWTFYHKHPEMASFLSTESPPKYSRTERLKMAALTLICGWTETRDWPDFSRYYPDLLSYYSNLGLLQARNE